MFGPKNTMFILKILVLSVYIQGGILVYFDIKFSGFSPVYNGTKKLAKISGYVM